MPTKFVLGQLTNVKVKYPDAYTEEDATGVLLILPTYSLPSHFHQSLVRVAIHVGPLYPTEKLDLFWVDPALQRRDGVPLPNLMNSSVMLGGKEWAQISWHDNGAYEPSHATIIGYLTGLRRWFEQ